ncbi:MAG: lipM [Frankiales bacterium]|nr:lipM [Frankiales bacterium]
MDLNTLFLVLAVLGALNTVNAYRPLSRRGPFAVLSYIGGWPTSELPLHVLVAQAVVVLVAVLTDGLDGTRGIVAIVLTALSWFGLVGLRVRAAQVPALMERVLREALGADYADRVVHPRRPSPEGARTPRRPGVVRMLRIRTKYVHDANLSYGDAGKSNLLDIWRHPDAGPGDRAPVLLQIPGGAWVFGNKQGQAYPLMSTMVERGWVCVSINYRLSPRSLWPAHIVDVKKAIAWVRANIADYGGDPDFIAVTGGSAGGHLTSLAALTWDDPDFQPGFEDADTRVAAAVSYYGVYDWSDEVETGGSIFLPHLQRTVIKQKWADKPEVFRQGSPLRRIRPDAPPFFVTVGVNDTMVSPRQPRYFVPRLRAVSTSPVVFAELPDTQHGYDTFSSPRSAAVADAVSRFLGVVYGRHLARRAGTEATPAP